jgi:sulfite exporter TauE/SafE
MIATALMMGLAGSLHCVGMCSPLAMTVSNLTARVFLNRLLYNAGRVLTYGLLGASVGSLSIIVPFSKFQNVVSIILGIILLFAGAGFLNVRIPLISILITKLTVFLKKTFAKFLARKNYTSVFILGALNGILPCGLVWAALAYSLALPSPLQGFGFMILFGAGTLPVMLGLTSLIPSLITRFNFNLPRLTSVMLIATGVLLVARVFVVHVPHLASGNAGFVDIVLCR